MSRFACAVVLPAAILFGCSPADTGSGSILVRWLVGGTSCAEAGIDSVKVHVRDGTKDIVNAVTALCSDGVAGTLMANVAEGTHTVYVEGFVHGTSMYENSGVFSVAKDKQTIVDPPIQLHTKDTVIRLAWHFDDGKLCTGHGVAHIDVTAFDEKSNQLFPADKSKLWTEYGCDPAPPDADPDGGVLLKGLPGDEMVSISLFGLNSAGKRVVSGKAKVKTAAGGETDFDVTLSACDPCI